MPKISLLNLIEAIRKTYFSPAENIDEVDFCSEKVVSIYANFYPFPSPKYLYKYNLNLDGIFIEKPSLSTKCYIVLHSPNFILYF